MKAINPAEGQARGPWALYHLLRSRQFPGLAPFAPGKIVSIVDVIPTRRKITHPPTASVLMKTVAGLRQKIKAKKTDMFGATIKSGPKRAVTLLKALCAMSVIKHSRARTGYRAIRGRSTLPRSDEDDSSAHISIMGSHGYFATDNNTLVLV